MRVNKISRYTVPFALFLLITACGGGGGGGVELATNNTDNIDESPVEPAAANPTSSAITVTGRVADGYIRGATVCVDINENDACDPDEPFAITVEGGAYDLAVPAAHGDKPIVAAIPAEAIDEDTGEAVGQPLVFIAPADRPEFLSPITTLVHQEQRANPALDTEDAEQAVKNMLGIDEDNVSLFADYVAQSDVNENTDGTAERFEYLHDTARVVASMMKDIENQVETAAVSKGVDVTGDNETRRAIQDIVRNEVRQLLPQIARQVAQIVGIAASSTEIGSATQVSTFDPQALAVSLRPEVETDSLTSRIEANINRVEVVDSDLRSLLSDGVYWMEFSCDYDGQDALESIEQSESADVDGDLMGITTFPMPDCEAMYGRVQLTNDGSELASESYVLNVAAGAWEPDEQDEDDRYANYLLVDGVWVIVNSDGPDGNIEFLTDNSAVITNEEGTMLLKSVTQTLDGSPVIHHLLEDGADPIWFEVVGRDDIFPSESRANRISVRQSYPPYVMFNFPSYDPDANYCIDYNQNCNVVEIVTDGQATTAVSLNQLRESVVQGVNLRTYSNFDGRPLMRLHGDAQADGQLPNQGRVEWILDADNWSTDLASTNGIDYVDNEFVGSDRLGLGDLNIANIPSIPGSNITTSLLELFSGVQPDPWDFTSHEVCVAELTEKMEDSDASTETTGGFFAPGDFAGALEELVVLIGERGDEIQGELPSVDGFDGIVSNLQTEQDVDEACSLIMSQVDLGDTRQNENSTENGDGNLDTGEDDFENPNGAPLTGRWKLVEVDSVAMIEIHLPIRFRNESDGESEEAMLLIEHDGFIRAGARLPGTSIDRVFTYNENAFETLRSIVEIGMSENQ